MKNKAIKVLKVYVKNSDLLEANFEFEFLTKINTVIGKNDEGINNLFNRVYEHNIIAISGMNATGKTIVLKHIMSIFMIYLELEGLNNLKKTYYSCFLKPGLCFGMYFCDKDNIYKIETTVNCDESNVQKKWLIEKEILFGMPINSRINKSNIFDDSNYVELVNRKNLNQDQKEFLSKDISIVKPIIDKNSAGLIVNSFNMTNFNILYDVGFKKTNSDELAFASGILKYLDPSIEYIKKVKELENTYSIKFYNSNEIFKVEDFGSLYNYLSSGTIKGASLLPMISYVLKLGGYLLIDEIEIHLNKAIVQSIIRIFSDPSLNHRHATIVFSTHYSELLDNLKRNDSIQITYRNKLGEIAIFNFSEELNRNDLKRSEVYASDYFKKGTAPSYLNYKEFIEEIKNISLEGESSDD